MAINTDPNPIRLVDTQRFTFFGYPVPPNVVAVETQRTVLDDMLQIAWKVKGDPTVHRMDIAVVTDETIAAVLAAMRLS